MTATVDTRYTPTLHPNAAELAAIDPDLCDGEEFERRVADPEMAATIDKAAGEAAAAEIPF